MGDTRVRVSIIIPHYNQKDCLPGLFSNLTAQTFTDFEVIFIDDRTPDESAVSFVKDFIKDKPWMHLVQNEENIRFVKTCNKGIGLAKGEYLCFLNADTELKNNFIQRNVEILDADPGIGGLTCSIVDQNGSNWFTGGRYEKGIPRNLQDDFKGTRTVDFIAGTCAFYRKDVFDRIGMFDETYIMYHEDIEFGLRIKEQTSYRLCTFSDKLVTHLILPSMSRSNVWYYGSRNLVELSKKYAPRYLPHALVYILTYYIAIHLVRAVRYAIIGIQGTIDGLLGRKARSF